MTRRTTFWLIASLAVLSVHCGPPTPSPRPGPTPGPTPTPTPTPTCSGAGPEAEGELGSALGARVASGTTRGARNDAAPSCGSSRAEDVTFRWVAPTDGTYVFDTNGSGYDTVLAVMDPCARTWLGCDDDGGDGLDSRLELALRAGQELLLAVDGFSGNAGEFVLSIHRAGTDGGPPPVTPRCPGADLGSALGEPVVSSRTTGRGDVVRLSCNDVLVEEATFSWTAPMTGTYVFDTRGSRATTAVALRSTSCDGVELGCDRGASRGGHGAVVATLMRGERVVVVVEATGSASDAFSLSILEADRGDGGDAPDAGCAPGETSCEGRCVDTQTSDTDCGRCGLTCVFGTTCVAGRCECPMGTTECTGGCVDTQRNSRHCGMCGAACPSTAPNCVDGACTP